MTREKLEELRRRAVHDPVAVVGALISHCIELEDRLERLSKRAEAGERADARPRVIG